MRVLGIDPGSRKTGWGVAEGRRGGARGVAAGVIRLKPGAPLADRLEIVYDAIDALIEEHRPQAMAVEDVFYAKYPNAAIKLGHVRGVVLLVAAKRGLALAEYSPALVKRTVSGRGAADKKQMGRIVGAMLGFDEPLAEDASDALAVALTHLSAARVRSR
ncbi:MAG TPA: crossover junction endodeoxyribonuclease RuvC [Sandaracinaceae bacterium LLY-WYZ-13_1]|nr:crossover junction endodeoxyribonuclease RuvC [Sandaracinaceae bacterium LLY-WYZ-13_1]